MNRKELQEKLNALLVGESTYNMYNLCDKVKDKLNEWFDNSNGYFNGVGLSGYTMWIRYKDRGFATFEIKRKKVDNIFVVKEVIVDNSFVDTETSIRAIKEHLKVSATNKRERELFNAINNCNIDLCVEMLSALKKQFSDKNAQELERMISALQRNYWVVEEETCNETNI